MSSFARTLAIKVEDYVTLRRSLGYAFQKRPRHFERWSSTPRSSSSMVPSRGTWRSISCFRGKALPTVALFGTGSFAASASTSRYTTHGRRQSIHAHYPEVVLFRRHAY